MENIKVLRRQEIETRELQVGDQIQISLAEIGDFTATAHKITDKGVLFVFDEYVARRPMNKKNTNKGGYEKSDLKNGSILYFWRHFRKNSDIGLLICLFQL